MTQRKKATSAASRPTRGGHLPGPPRAAGTARKGTPRKPVEKTSTLPVSPTAAPATAVAPSLVSLTWVLPAECLVSQASSLKESLAGLLDEPLPVTLDATALQRIDTAGLQLITAFVRDRAGHGRTVEWQGTTPVLTTAAQLLGLTSLIKLPA
jgi:ABC-type transporter Mla MlaB component